MNCHDHDRARPTLLLIDDCVSQRDLYEVALEEEFNILTATRGGDGLNAAVNLHPDAIVLDVLMPGLDGWETCTRIKSDRATSAIPVILLTGANDPDLSDHARAVGATTVLTKPCPADRLRDTVLAVLGNSAPHPSTRTWQATSTPGFEETMMERGTSIGGTRRGPNDTDRPACSFLLEETPLRGRVLVVDDSNVTARLLSGLLMHDGHIVRTAGNGDEALALVAREQPDLVLMDVMMPGKDGFEACRALKEDASTRLIPVVLVTALQDFRDKVRGLEAGADDFLTKPVNASELRVRVRSLLRLKRYTDDLESADSVLLTLAQTIEARDAYTEGHCQRLARYAVALGRTLGLDARELADLDHGGFLHDIGKVAIPDAVLFKSGPLSVAEYELVKTHTIIGDRLCSGLRSLRGVRAIVRHHHERLDGSGYPDRLRGDAIPLLAQIIGIVDVYDALTTTRPYKNALDERHASEELRGEAQRGWRRADLVDAFIAVERRLAPEKFW